MGDLEVEKGIRNRLLGTDEGPQHKWGALLMWGLLEQGFVFFTWWSFLSKA